MSYILDALKKSDQERQQEVPPHLHSNHGYPPSFKDSGRGQRFLIGGIVAASLLLGGATMYLYNLAQQPKPQPIQQSPAKVNPPAPEPIVQQQVTTPAEPVVKMVEAPPEIRETPSTPIRIPRDRSKILFTPFGDQEVEEEYTLAKPPEPPSPLPLFKDLPPNLRTQIPKFSFAGHTYSQDPAQRMIIINNNISREGDRIDLNTRLKEITWEGVIIDFKGISFRVEAL